MIPLFIFCLNGGGLVCTKYVRKWAGKAFVSMCWFFHDLVDQNDASYNVLPSPSVVVCQPPVESFLSPTTLVALRLSQLPSTSWPRWNFWMRSSPWTISSLPTNLICRRGDAAADSSTKKGTRLDKTWVNTVRKISACCVLKCTFHCRSSLVCYLWTCLTSSWLRQPLADLPYTTPILRCLTNRTDSNLPRNLSTCQTSLRSTGGPTSATFEREFCTWASWPLLPTTWRCSGKGFTKIT